MKLTRIVFEREVPSPRAPSLARVHWSTTFELGCAITREGDAVRIVDSETGRTFLYPWSSVAAAEPAPPEAQVQPVVVHPKSAQQKRYK